MNPAVFTLTVILLIRKIIKEKKVSLKTKTPYKSSKRNLGDDLIEPTKIYVKYVLPLIKKKKFQLLHILQEEGFLKI